MSNNDWKELAELWQADAAINLQELTRKTRRKTLQMRLAAGHELVVGLVVAMFGVWVIRRNLGQVEFWAGIFLILIATGGIYATWWSRRGAWNAASESLIDQLRLAKQRAVAGRRLADANLWSTIPAAGILSLVLFRIWDEIVDADLVRQHHVLIPVTTAVLIVVGTVIWGVRYRRKKRKEIERIETILAEMEMD